MHHWRKDSPGFPREGPAFGVALLVVVILLAAWLPTGQVAPSREFTSETLWTGSHVEQPSTSSRPLATPLTWTELLPEGLPPSNSTTTPVLVYDPVTQQTLDFASASPFGLTSIWSFDAGVWTNVSPPGNLTHQDLSEFSATFDAADGYLLLFGYVGDNDQTPGYAQTWKYSAGLWAQLSPRAEPRGTPMAGVTYDPVDSSTILLTTLYFTNDSLTWSFQGGNWTRLVTSGSPPALFGSTMVFDNSTADQELVLFADGIQAPGPTRGFWNQTWVYRGNQWLNVTATSGPAPPADEGAMTYDSSEHVVLLVDHAFFANSTPARTWEFTDSRWVYFAAPSIAPFLGDGGSNFVYDPHETYSIFVGSYPSAYSGNWTTQTWKLDHTDIGAPPTLALNVTPRNLTEGATVHITASATGGYGALAVVVQFDIPGCAAIERRTGSWNCTSKGSGEGIVSLGVTDQSGRVVSVSTILQIAPPVSPSTDWLLYALSVGAVVAALGVAAAIVIRRRKRPPTPANATSSASGSGGPPETPGIARLELAE